MKMKVILSVLVVLVLASIFWIKFKRINGFEEILVSKGSIIEAVYGLGLVKSNQEYEVKVGITSKVKKVFVKEGDWIIKNQKLVEFEPDLIFRSPIDGVVSLLDIHEAELASAQKTVLKVENLKDLYIEVSLDQEGALQVRPGQEAKIVFESLRNVTYDAEVASIFSRNQEFLAKIKINQFQDNILPGMSSDVAIVISKHSDALLIPIAALSGQGTCMVKRNRQIQKIAVRMGAIDGVMGQVLEGDLQAGDIVLVPSKKQ